MMQKHMKRHLSAALAVTFASVSAAIAAERTIPTPAPSGHVDTESSVNVPLADWPDLGRRVRIDLMACATPSNAVQIAFGQDTNGDEDLEPEETVLVIGVDCGEPFVREEEGVGDRCRCTAEFVDSASLNADEHNEEDNHLCTPTPNTYTFRLKQPSAVSNRITHAKVTTRGREDTAAQIAAEITRSSLVLFLR